VKLVRHLAIIVVVTVWSGCAGKQARIEPPKPAPIVVPEAVELKTEADYRAHEETAKRCMRWLLQTHPAAEPKVWTPVRDFALDWIEGAPYVDASPSMAILEKVIMDQRFYYSVYMRGAYLSARTLHRLEHPDATDVEAEVAAIAGMQQLFAVFKAADPEARSRRLRKYAKLAKRGKLEAYVAKKLAKGE